MNVHKKIFTIKIVRHQRLFIVFFFCFFRLLSAYKFLLFTVPKWMTCLCEKYNTICREVFAFSHWKNTCINIECRLGKKGFNDVLFYFFPIKGCCEKRASFTSCLLIHSSTLCNSFRLLRRKNNRKLENHQHFAHCVG